MPTPSSRLKHEESKTNSELMSEIRRKLELGTEENWNTAEISQVANSQPASVSSLTHFDQLFVTFS